MEYRWKRGSRMSCGPSGTMGPEDGKKTEKEKEAETEMVEVTIFKQEFS